MPFGCTLTAAGGGAGFKPALLTMDAARFLSFPSPQALAFVLTEVFCERQTIVKWETLSYFLQ
jgi:hypothetical protein